MLHSFSKYISALFLLLIGFHLVVTGQPKSNKPNSQTQVSAVDSGNIHPAPPAYPSGIKLNYVRTREAKGPISDTATFNSSGYEDVKEMTAYFDGLGRDLQRVERQASPGLKDVVSPHVYDEFGREVYKYLPYVATTGSSTADGNLKMNPFVDQAAFYSNTTLNPSYAGEQAYYTQTNFEASPLSRTLKTMAPGNSWAGANNGGRGIEHIYMVNTTFDSVRIWTISNDTLTYVNNDSITNIPTSNAFYNAGQLYKNVLKDERGNINVEYKDKEGLIILKKVQIGNIAADYSGYNGFLCTYYIYDDFNRLRFVIQPKGTVLIAAANWLLSDEIIKELCFRYEFDKRGRMKGKKVPGAGWVYMVYDSRDRLVFAQDGNMRIIHPTYNSKMWMTTLYEPLNRPVVTGMMFSNASPGDLQRYVDGLSDSNSNSSFILDSTGSITADLSVPLREAGKTSYQATSSITFEDEFESESIADFTAEIISGSGGQASNLQYLVSNNPIPNSNDLNFIPLTITYYDSYDSVQAAFTSSHNSKLVAGNNLHLESAATQSSRQMTGLVTKTLVRILKDPNDFLSGGMLSSTMFYDDKGRTIQIQADNYKGGKDTTTIRYNYTGLPVCKYDVINNPSSGAPRLTIMTLNEYDHVGRLLEIKKQINDDASNSRTIVKHEYNELGQLKEKKLGQEKNAQGTWTTTPIESLEYLYNIRGWIKAINKDYANNSGSNNSNRWFGMEMGYDWGFDSLQFSGNISGIKWRTRGDEKKRAFGFTYDKANRIMGADFSGGNSSYHDFTAEKFDMQMGDGQTPSTAYDENGNIKKMKQWGYQLTTSSVIDDLTYNYISNSNKLLNVIDGANNPQTKLGDFRTSNLHPASGNKSNTTADYAYDVNGNMVKDLNKDIGSSTASGIQYNHLNLPYKITVNDSAGIKGTITYIYDAIGNKLDKKVTEHNLAEKRTTYLNGAVFENDSLQFISHDEGRIRYAKKYFVSGDSAYQFIYDYFVKDHLGNVRMVLTEQSDTAKYFATMEAAYRQKENLLFYNIPQTSYPVSLVPGGYPSDGTTSPNDSLIKLNGSSNTIGPGLMLKITGGDKVDIASKYFFRPNSNPGSNTNPLVDILSSLATGIISFAGETKGTFSALTNTSTSPLLAGANFIVNAGGSSGSTVPKAGLCWISFDEDFLQIGAGFVTSHIDEVLNTLAYNDIPNLTKGYLYIFVMNETQNWDVFFDNLSVTHRTGALIEETHYYPFGLAMTGISSKALKPNYVENKYKFNDGTELNTSLDIGLYETDHRLYDPQIGKFVQIDGIAEAFEEWSPYTFSFNNPILFNDPSGLAADTGTNKVNLDPVYVVAKVPKKLDTENGQVYPPLGLWSYIFGSNREWNGYTVNNAGYVQSYHLVTCEVHDFGSKGLAKKGANVVNKWMVYKSMKRVNGQLKLYIGKAKNSISKRYTKKEIEAMTVEVLDKLEALPDNATALGVEQAVLMLNGGVGATANIKNAAVKKIYIEAGTTWLNANIPNWKEVFKYQ